MMNFKGLRPPYRVILADPPWRFAVRSPKGDGRSASRHYGTMPLERLWLLPVSRLAAPDCALFLWTTDPMLEAGLAVMKAWGFTYKTVAFHWAKQNPSGTGFHCGMGYWTRANPEICLLGTRGRPKRLARDVRRLIVSPRREHSRKPDEAYSAIERLVSGPYLELFARTRRPGWDCWGRETDKFKPYVAPQELVT